MKARLFQLAEQISKIKYKLIHFLQIPVFNLRLWYEGKAISINELVKSNTNYINHYHFWNCFNAILWVFNIHFGNIGRNSTFLKIHIINIKHYKNWQSISKNHKKNLPEAFCDYSQLRTLTWQETDEVK